MTAQPSDGPVRQVHWNDDAAVVEAAGEIDLNASPDFQQELLALLDRRPTALVVDLSDVPYMDSSGVASLVKVLSRARTADIRLALAALTPRVRSVLEITRLDTVFELHDTVQEALAAS